MRPDIRRMSELRMEANSSLEHRRDDMRSLRLALGLYVVIFALKMVAYFATGVMVVLAEALHTFTDILISGFLLLAAVLSRKEADADHMYGHGRAQNVAALVAATLFVSITSLQLFQGALPRLFTMRRDDHQNLPIAVAVLVVSMAIAAVPMVKLVLQRQKGAAAKAQMLELVNDQLGLLAALGGTVFVAVGYPAADPIATIAVATIIAFNAFNLMRENASFLLGRSPGPEQMREIRKLARSVPGVLDVHDLRAEYIGPDTVRAGMHITVPRGITVEAADRIAEEVQEKLHEATGCGYCVVHVDASEGSPHPPGPLPSGKGG